MILSGREFSRDYATLTTGKSRDPKPKLQNRPRGKPSGAVFGIRMPEVFRPSRVSDTEALTAGTAGLGIGVGKLETTGHQLARVVEHGAFEVERGLRIDQHRGAGR